MVLTSAVEFEGSLELDALLGGLRLRIRLLSSVQAIDVGLVVFRVMQIHNLPRNMRLQCLSDIPTGYIEFMQ